MVVAAGPEPGRKTVVQDVPFASGYDATKYALFRFAEVPPPPIATEPASQLTVKACAESPGMVFDSFLITTLSKPGPLGPAGPRSPWSPLSPFKPWSPLSPFGPCGPCGPCG